MTETIRLAIRCAFAVMLLGVCLSMGLMRNRWLTDDRAIVIPPVEDRLPLVGQMAEDREDMAKARERAKAEAIARARKAEELRKQEEAKKLADAEAARQAEADRKAEEEARRQQALKDAERLKAERLAREAAARKAFEDARKKQLEAIQGPVKNAYIAVFPKKRFIGLVQGSNYLLKFYNIAVPEDLDGGKASAADTRPPMGTYFVCAREDGEDGKMLQLSYPNTDDAKKAKERGDIDQATFDKITAAIKARKTPPQDTPLGGYIYITGDRHAQETTRGGFAIEQPQMEALWKATQIGTWVTIR